MAVASVRGVELVRVVSRALRRDEDFAASLRLLIVDIVIGAGGQLGACLDQYLIAAAAL